MNSNKNDFQHIFESKFMVRAIELSHLGAIVKKCGGPFGAVVVKDGKVVGEGHNCVLSKKDPTCHAEIEAIRDACANLGSFDLAGCVLYTSSECCPMCYSAAYWANLDHIFYASTIKDAEIYGNFADLEILDELKKEPNEQQLKKIQYMRNEALEVWRKYSEMTDKIGY